MMRSEGVVKGLGGMIGKPVTKGGSPTGVTVRTTISIEEYREIKAQMEEARPKMYGGWDRGSYLKAAGVSRVYISFIDEKRGVYHAPVGVELWTRAYHGVGTPSLWISGGTGAGKTTAAIWALSEVGKRSAAEGLSGKRAAYVRVPTLVNEVWMGASLYGPENRHVQIKKYKGCELLVLDDLGSCSRGREECAAVREIVDHRWSEELPTIFTTQYGLSEYAGILRRAGADDHDIDSLKSRIIASVGGYLGVTKERVKENIVTIDGDDLRILNS